MKFGIYAFVFTSSQVVYIKAHIDTIYVIKLIQRVRDDFEITILKMYSGPPMITKKFNKHVIFFKPDGAHRNFYNKANYLEKILPYSCV